MHHAFGDQRLHVGFEIIGFRRRQYAIAFARAVLARLHIQSGEFRHAIGQNLEGAGGERGRLKHGTAVDGHIAAMHEIV